MTSKQIVAVKDTWDDLKNTANIIDIIEFVNNLLQDSDNSIVKNLYTDWFTIDTKYENYIMDQIAEEDFEEWFSEHYSNKELKQVLPKEESKFYIFDKYKYNIYPIEEADDNLLPELVKDIDSLYNKLIGED